MRQKYAVMRHPESETGGGEGGREGERGNLKNKKRKKEEKKGKSRGPVMKCEGRMLKSSEI